MIENMMNPPMRLLFRAAEDVSWSLADNDNTRSMVETLLANGHTVHLVYAVPCMEKTEIAVTIRRTD